MSAPKVVMYAADWCGYCARARRLLDAKGVQYEEIDVDLVPGAQAGDAGAQRPRARSRRFSSATEHIGGCDELHALEADGRLDSLLKATEP